MDRASSLLRILGDETRLRLLRVLATEPLNVSELTAILGVAQSGVSRHLSLLKKAGLVEEERTGAFAWYRLTAEAEATEGAATALWHWLREEFGRATPRTRADDARLAEVRRLRHESFVQHGDDRHQLVPGRSWMAWSRALGLLLPPLEVADLGCGEGYLTIETARWAKHVTGIDRSQDVLSRARAMAARRKITNITWMQGDLERVPLGDESVDLVMLSQALHHARDPKDALAEARRVLRPSGRLLVLDLRAHDEQWVRGKLGDTWLGFADRDLLNLMRGAGFDDVAVNIGTSRAEDPFTVLIAAGAKHLEQRIHS